MTLELLGRHKGLVAFFTGERTLLAVLPPYVERKSGCVLANKVALAAAVRLDGGAIDPVDLKDVSLQSLIGFEI